MRFAAILCVLAAACSEPDFWSFESRTGGPNPGFTATAIWIDDSPVDGAEHVFVVFERVELSGPQGVHVLAEGRKEVDLLALRNGRSELLADTEAPAGTWSRLVLRLAPDGARIVVGGRSHPLELARAQSAEISIPGLFELADGGRREWHVDFNARLSVVDAGGRWLLEPVASLLAESGGFVSGTVLDGAGAPRSDATVSVQQGGREIVSTRTDPDGSFRLGPLEPSTYALVATAPGHAPAVSRNVTVAAGSEAGRDPVLAPAAAGTLEGVGPTGAPGVVARLLKDGAFVAQAGVDPATGAYAFRDVAPGAYEVQLWSAGALLDVRAATAD